jgi:hypothetical protein
VPVGVDEAAVEELVLVFSCWVCELKLGERLRDGAIACAIFFMWSAISPDTDRMNRRYFFREENCTRRCKWLPELPIPKIVVLVDFACLVSTL